MTVLLLQVSEEVSQSIPYKMGYAVGYFGHTYFWQIMAFLVLLTAGAVYLFIKKRKARKSLEEL
ncbi:hypothetical protein [Salinimicrobium sp. GXAS 041]|uniref:hypothetical protein n=1 Tax=Salinimicrobium sp. GXAS 041 TaxID=3400806 RepID=UPI003C771531